MLEVPTQYDVITCSVILVYEKETSSILNKEQNVVGFYGDGRSQFLMLIVIVIMFPNLIMVNQKMDRVGYLCSFPIWI